MALEDRYRRLVKAGELKADAAQAASAKRLATLAEELRSYRPGRWTIFAKPAPRGLYIWGDVGRGKSMLMDLFFESAPVSVKERIHFNAFMVETHARIHEAREKGESDPIPPVAKIIAKEATLLCFDEFQVTDIADAMVLGRLFDQLFEVGVVVVATSNTPPDRLYEGGLNRQLFLPFIATLKEKLDVIELSGLTDYRRLRMAGLDMYVTPLGPAADAKLDAAWQRLTDTKHGEPAMLTVLGRKLIVPQAAKHVARFSFRELCAKPLAAADYLAIAQAFHTVVIDNIPVMTPDMRNEARRFTVLIDTLYDEGVKIFVSAAAPPDELFTEGDGTESFRRTASRLTEMQSSEYVARGHGVHGV